MLDIARQKKSHNGIFSFLEHIEDKLSMIFCVRLLYSAPGSSSYLASCPHLIKGLSITRLTTYSNIENLAATS